MGPTPSAPPGPALPRWLVLGGSLLIAVHLGAIVVNALAASSGPWVTAQGPEPGTPPYLPRQIQQTAALPYLSVVRMSHNYHYPSNRVGAPEAYLEFRLFGEDDQVIKTVRLPDLKASR